MDFILYGYYFVELVHQCRQERRFSRPMRVLHVGKYMHVATRGCMFDVHVYLCVCRSQRGRVAFQIKLALDTVHFHAL